MKKIKIKKINKRFVLLYILACLIAFFTPFVIDEIPTLSQLQQSQNSLEELEENFRASNSTADLFKVVDYLFADIGEGQINHTKIKQYYQELFSRVDRFETFKIQLKEDGIDGEPYHMNNMLWCVYIRSCINVDGIESVLRKSEEMYGLLCVDTEQEFITIYASLRIPETNMSNKDLEYIAIFLDECVKFAKTESEKIAIYNTEWQIYYDINLPNKGDEAKQKAEQIQSNQSVDGSVMNQSVDGSVMNQSGDGSVIDPD